MKKQQEIQLVALVSELRGLSLSLFQGSTEFPEYKRLCDLSTDALNLLLEKKGKE